MQVHAVLLVVALACITPVYSDSTLTLTLIENDTNEIDSAVIVLSNGKTAQLSLRDNIEAQAHLYNDCEGAVHVHNYGFLVISAFVDSKNISSFTQTERFSLFVKCTTGRVRIHTTSNAEVFKNKVKHEFKVLGFAFKHLLFWVLVFVIILSGAILSFGLLTICTITANKHKQLYVNEK